MAKTFHTHHGMSAIPFAGLLALLSLTQSELKIRQTHYGDTLVFRRRP